MDNIITHIKAAATADAHAEVFGDKHKHPLSPTITPVNTQMQPSATDHQSVNVEQIRQGGAAK